MRYNTRICLGNIAYTTVGSLLTATCLGSYSSNLLISIIYICIAFFHEYVFKYNEISKYVTTYTWNAYIKVPVM